VGKKGCLRKEMARANRNFIPDHIWDDGSIQSIIDALNKATFMSYSAAGCGSCGGGVDKLTQVTDANGKSTTYTYDKLGRLLTETDATGLQKSFDYNPNRYEYTKTDARGIAITYVNDYMGRLTEKKVEGVTKETYSYYINGRLHRASKDDLTYTYTYYADGQVRDVTDSKGKKLSYKYDALGIRTEVNINDGMGLNRTITYTYTDANQLDTITAEPGVFDYDYRVDGSREKLTYPNTVFTNYSYDASGRMVGIDTPGVSSTVYSYDKVGNRLSNATDGKKISYIYDDLYRLRFASHTSTEGAMFENYTYDAIGNRQAHENDLINNYYPGFDPDFTNSTTVGGFTYYDVAGKGYQTPFTDVADSVDYGYDYEERLIRVKRVFGLSSTVVEYKYDVSGRRIERKVTTDGTLLSTINYFYDNEDIVAVYENGVLTKEFIHGPGIDEPLAIKTGGNWYYYHADGLGSVMKLTNASGAAEPGYSFGYDSFGNLAKGSLDKNYTYTGREWDAEAGLYYYRARFYDAEVGRFISKDPIGFAGGDYNLYSYVSQNPVNFTDPSGLICVYSRNSANLRCTSKGKVIVNARVYSGYSNGINNPKMENVKNMGPTPSGMYTIGPPIEVGRTTWRRITPDSFTRAKISSMGRNPDSFWIHGDNKYKNDTASKGCLILNAGDGRNDIPTGDILIVR